MPLQLNPTNLQGLVDLPVGMRPQQEEFLANASRNDSQMLQQQGLANLFQQRADPLRVRGLELSNQTAEAGLSGVVAQGKSAERKNRIESLMEDKQIQDMMGKYKSEELSRHVKDMEGVGQLALQGAEQVWSNPIGGRALVKQKLEKTGMWNPKWDSLPPDRLAMELSNFGQGLQATGAKFSQAVQLQDDKLAAQERMKRMEVEQRSAAAQLRASSAQALLAAKPKPEPKNFEDQSRKWYELALAEDDPAPKAGYMQNAEYYKQAAIELRSAAANVASGDKPNLPALGIKDNTTARKGPALGTKENPIKLD